MTKKDWVQVAIIFWLLIWALLTVFVTFNTAHAQTAPYQIKRVTAYCIHGYTASGAWTRWGSVAAPHHTRFGTQLYIEGYGYGIVQDRGGAIYNDRLDIWFPSCRQAINWGVRYVRVWTY